MNIQELEEQDHNPFGETDYQRVFRHSSATREPDDSQKIRDELAKGKHLLILETLDYCNHTDAIIGIRKTILSSHDNHDAALLAQAGEDLIRFGDSFNEDHYYILPQQPITNIKELEAGPPATDDSPF